MALGGSRPLMRARVDRVAHGHQGTTDLHTLGRWAHVGSRRTRPCRYTSALASRADGSLRIHGRTPARGASRPGGRGDRARPRAIDDRRHPDAGVERGGGRPRRRGRGRSPGFRAGRRAARRRRLPHGRPSRRLLPRGQRAGNGAAARGCRAPRRAPLRPHLDGRRARPRREPSGRRERAVRAGRHLPGDEGGGGDPGLRLPPPPGSAGERGASGRHLRARRDPAAQALSRDRPRALRDRGHGADLLPPRVHRRPRRRLPARARSRPGGRGGVPDLRAELRLAAGPRGARGEAHRRPRAPVPDPGAADPVGGRPRRGDLRAARDRAAAAPAGASTSGPRAGRSRSRRRGGCSATTRRSASTRASRARPRGTARRGGCERAPRTNRTRAAGARARPGNARGRPAARRAGRAVGRQRDVSRDGLEPRARSRPALRRGRPRALPHRIPERPAGSLPEAHERRHHFRRRFRIPVAAARAARGGAAVLRQAVRPPAVRGAVRPAAGNARVDAGQRPPAGIGAVVVVRGAAAAWPCARLRARHGDSARPARRRAGLSRVADARDLRLRARHGRARGVGGRAAAPFGTALRHRGLPEAAERADGGAARARAAAAGGRRALARAAVRTQAPGIAPARGRAGRRGRLVLRAQCRLHR